MRMLIGAGSDADRRAKLLIYRGAWDQLEGLFTGHGRRQILWFGVNPASDGRMVANQITKLAAGSKFLAT